MNNQLIIKLFLLLFFTIFAYSKPILIGNPYIEKYKEGEDIYARNIWDMQLFNGKIYLGAGNSSNKGPAQNAGRVYVVSLDPKTDKFKNEYKVAEEQVDIFKVYNNTLYIPGHDATQKWTYGNIYTKNNGKWKKYRTLPKALHVYDLVVKDGKIFTAIGLKGKGAVFVSDMNAKEWKEIAHGKGRVYSFLEVGNELFATKTFRKKYPNKLNMTQWIENRETFSSRYNLNIQKMFPDTKIANSSIKMTKYVKVERGTFFLGAYKHNDHQSKPFGLYFIDNNLNVKKVELNKNEKPRDIIVRNGNIFLLVNNEDNIFVKKIDKSLIASNYISFKYPTFARSFEEYNGCFYFGMGSDLKSSRKWTQKELKVQTGNVIKVCKNGK